MQRVNEREFNLMVKLDAGSHQYKFIIDGQWRCAEDQPKVKDNHGNLNNIVEIAKIVQPVIQQPFIQIPNQQAQFAAIQYDARQQQYTQQFDPNIKP